MGQEAVCKVTVGRMTREAKVLLETSEIIVRGEPRLRIAFREITSAQARAGKLILERAAGRVTFDLGERAEKWAEKIRNPKALLDKLGVKAEHLVCVLGVDDDAFVAQLRERAAGVTTGRATKGAGIVFLGASSERDLARLTSLASAIASAGALWVVYPKGNRAISEAAVLAAGKRAGLVDTKVASFSATHTALKFVIPVAKR